MDEAEAPRRDRLRRPRTGPSRSASIARLPGRRGPRRRRATARQQFESWSLAKSVTALVFGRAMSLGLIGPDDPLGSLVPEADRRPRRDHDARPADDDLAACAGTVSATTTSSLPDRVQEALTVAGRKAARDLLGVLAERPGAARRGDPSARPVRTSRTLPSASSSARSGSSRAPGTGRRDGAGHTQGFFGLQHAPRRLRPPRRADAPRRRLARPAPALARVRARGGRAGHRERLLRLADLAQRVEAVRRPARSSIARSRDERDFPDAARRRVPVLRACSASW